MALGADRDSQPLLHLSSFLHCVIVFVYKLDSNVLQPEPEKKVDFSIQLMNEEISGGF